MPSGRSAIASVPRTGRPSRRATAIGQSACGNGVPFGVNNRQEPHEWVSPIGGYQPQSVAAASL